MGRKLILNNYSISTTILLLKEMIRINPPAYLGFGKMKYTALVQAFVQIDYQLKRRSKAEAKSPARHNSESNLKTDQ